MSPARITLAAVLLIAGYATMAQGIKPGAYKEPVDMHRGTLPPPVVELMPKEAGGVCINYLARSYPAGVVYSFWCKDGGGYKFVAIPTRNKEVFVGKTQRQLRDKLAQFDIEEGMSGTRGTLLRAEISAQRDSTQPKTD